MIPSCFPPLVLGESSRHCLAQDWVCAGDAGLIWVAMEEQEMHLPEMPVLCASFFPAL